MKVVLLKGGRSSEHDVSLNSAEAIGRGLTEAGHEVIDVLITREGKWLLAGEPFEVRPDGGLLGADVVFPALHGPYGEDGVVQGLLEVLDVPYVGSNVAASALCMDKLDLKDLLAEHGLPQVEYVRVSGAGWKAKREELAQRIGALGLPLFVKPARLGSSVGISKVRAVQELETALDVALQHDSVAIVEAGSPGQEVECAVLGTVDPIASVPGEVIVKKGDWYDYEAKYSDDGMELKVPAAISKTATATVQRLAKEAFHRAGCSGLARVDFFVEGDRVLLSEINTMPGFTAMSAYPKLLESSGVPFVELLDRLLKDAIEHYHYVNRLKH